MTTLPADLRRKLERAARDARNVATTGAQKALEALAVCESDPYRHMDEAQRTHRRKLRAQARQLGDGESQVRPGTYGIKHLVEKLAYDQWHRLLFARFLLENNLLISPEHAVSVTLDDCEELAPSLGLKDAWAVAARFAAVELPEIFRADDPAGGVELPVEDRKGLIQLVTGLPVEVFTASDSLGWCYQFWQAERKDQVNAVGNKIGADELPSVTQLFTEDYMVDFLLDNTLGAWHAGKVLAANPKLAETAQSEDVLRQAVALSGCPWKYLRFVKVARPSRSGSFADPNRDGPVTITSGENLPHWTRDHAVYHVAFRLADSVPLSKREEWIRERESIAEAAKRGNRELTTEEEDRIRFLYSERIEKFLDSGCGECLLNKSGIAELVAGAIRHFEGQRYTLHSWCVMPNHVHVIVEPLLGHDLSNIIHSWKSFTAHEINKRLGRTGDVWQHDAYNHIIRSEREYGFQTAYVWENPDKARLPGWKWRWVVARPSRSGEEASASRSESESENDQVQNDQPQTGTVWLPACTFPGWPKSAADLRALDPCMGSGHFVVALFERLVTLRMAEEKLDEAAAVAAVIRDNLFGLEIDPRCTQIGAFNLALAAWRRVGHCKLPAMNLACSGLAPNTKREDWLKLTEGAPQLRFQMGALYDLFEKAPVLGSLINPRADKAVTYGEALHELQPLLEKALAQETMDDTAHEMAVTARGLAKAAEVLAGQFTLVATNVPYLGRGKQDEVLQEYCERVHRDVKSDLATCFVERCLSFCEKGGSTALVTPQNWLFLGTYKRMRQRLFREAAWNVVAKLGPAAFQDMNWWAANTAVFVLTNEQPKVDADIAGLDVSTPHDPQEKATLITTIEVTVVPQSAQPKNPDARLLLKLLDSLPLLEKYAVGLQGISPADYAHYGRFFWELTSFAQWRWWQSTIDETISFGGRELILWWNQDLKDAVEAGSAFVRGDGAWGKSGVVVRQMRHLPCCIYTGEAFDTNCAVIVPHDPHHIPAMWAFCSSAEFATTVRQIDQKTNVTNSTLVKVPFDLAHWQQVAAEKYPDGLPKPFSSDPTQWLFDGNVARASRSGSEEETPDRDGLVTDGLATLQVAVARLLGYQWPRQTGSSFPDCPALGPDGLETLADDVGIVPISPAKGEGPAAERLRKLLARAYGKDWNAQVLEDLLSTLVPRPSSLEDWLRNGFFEQHCALFHHRPFIWHVWDGLKNGFSALVNYHKLTHANLEKLTFAYLGDWIRRQQAAVAAEEAGSDAKLQAAKQLQATLKLILEGEPPYDIFVRWKGLASQAIGWHPDLNDGVRMNIRPFATADILRKRVKIKWDKDRGKEPARGKKEFPWFWGWDEEKQDFAGGHEFTGDRWNDCHYTGEFKKKASK